MEMAADADVDRIEVLARRVRWLDRYRRLIAVFCAAAWLLGCPGGDEPDDEGLETGGADSGASDLDRPNGLSSPPSGAPPSTEVHARRPAGFAAEPGAPTCAVTVNVNGRAAGAESSGASPSW